MAVTIVPVKLVGLITPLRLLAQTETNGLDPAVYDEPAFDMTL